VNVVTEAFARVFGQDPAILSALMLDQSSADPAALRGLAELCREAGAIEEARQLYSRLADVQPDDVKTQAMLDVLTGRRTLPAARPGEIWPTPFVRVFDFLSTDLHAEILAMTKAALPHFSASQINLGHEKGVDPSRRVSSVLSDSTAYRATFKARLEAAVIAHDVAATLGVDRSRFKHYDLQVTCHGDGDYFRAHTDTGEQGDTNRVVSFVYYFNNEPRAFTGGGLRLFDAAVDTKRYRPDSFTRIEPVNNSAVFFPSTAPHEVERVEVPSGAMIDGRFSINGWIIGG
jgi:Rps23 Pro-64 3,4-dihydroxylase Tpa1-like proline 4-hydroxylase